MSLVQLRVHCKYVGVPVQLGIEVSLHRLSLLIEVILDHFSLLLEVSVDQVLRLWLSQDLCQNDEVLLL